MSNKKLYIAIRIFIFVFQFILSVKSTTSTTACSSASSVIIANSCCLGAFNIPTTTTSITANAYASCHSITSVTIPSTVVIIGISCCSCYILLALIKVIFLLLILLI